MQAGSPARGRSRDLSSFGTRSPPLYSALASSAAATPEAAAGGASEDGSGLHRSVSEPALPAHRRRREPEAPQLTLPEAAGRVPGADLGACLRERTVRLFVSSTFLDFGPEREALMRIAAPALAHACAQRSLGFVVVDLRWGITEHESRAGRALSLCLREVDRCRPFFLGMLGQRYGWHQAPGAPRDALLAATVRAAAEEFPFVSLYPDRSVTEARRPFGVSGVPSEGRRSWRCGTGRSCGSSTSGRPAAGRRGRGRGGAGPAHAGRARRRLRFDGTPEEPAEAAAAALEPPAERMRALREEVRASGLPLLRGRLPPRELAEAVLAHFRAAVAGCFPLEGAGEGPSRALRASEALGCALVRGWVERRDLFASLDRLAAAGAPSSALRPSILCRL
eukprot:tig00000093_g3528.t1